jgi:hypothetical protein
MPRDLRVLALAHCVLAVGCLGGDEPSPDAGPPDTGPRAQPVFPADFARTYEEMRDCRQSHEHELHYIRVMVSPTAQAPYAALSPDMPYPAGATLLKVEYDEEDCAGPVVLYTAYRKLELNANPIGNDWLWQRVSPEREVIEQGAPWVCVNCHMHHCAPPMGYDLTCAEEL